MRPNVQKFLVRHSIIVSVRSRPVPATGNGNTRKMVKRTAVVLRLPTGLIITGVTCKMALNAIRPHTRKFLMRHGVIVSVQLHHVPAKEGGNTREMASITTVALRPLTGLTIIGATCKIVLNAIRLYLQTLMVRHGSTVSVRPHHVRAQENGSTRKMVKLTVVASRLPIGQAIIGVTCKMRPIVTLPHAQKLPVRHDNILNVRLHHVHAKENGNTRRMVRPTTAAPKLPTGRAIIGVTCKMAPNALQPFPRKFTVRHDIMLSARLRHVLAQENGVTRKMVRPTLVAPRLPTGSAIIGVTWKTPPSATRP